MEALERRAILMLVVIALLLVEELHYIPSPKWLFVVLLIGFACLAAATVLLVAVVAPAEYVGRWDSERSRLLFYAFALIAADVLVTLAILAYEARQTTFGGG